MSNARALALPYAVSKPSGARRGDGSTLGYAGVSSAHYTDASPIRRQARTDSRRAADSESTHTKQQ